MRVSGSRVEGRPLGDVAEGIHCELTFYANRGLPNNGLQTDESLKCLHPKFIPVTVLDLFTFIQQSRYRRRNLVDGFRLAQESVNASAPGFLLAIVS